MQVSAVVLQNARTFKAITLVGFPLKFEQWSLSIFSWTEIFTNYDVFILLMVDYHHQEGFEKKTPKKKCWRPNNVSIINIPLSEEKLSLSILTHVKSEGGALCEPLVLVTIFGFTRTYGWLASWATISTWIRKGFNGFKVRLWVAWFNSLWWWRYRTGKYGEQTTSKLLRFVVTQTFHGSPIA